MVKEKPYCYGDVDQSHQMTVSDLKKILAELPDEALIFMEPANAANRGNSFWSDKVLDYYGFDATWNGKKALMLIGSVR